MNTYAGLLVLAAAILVPTAHAQVVDWPPDLIIDPTWLNDHVFVNDVVVGRIHLRLANGTPNIGMGKFFLRVVEGKEAIEQGTAKATVPINQRIFRSDGSSWERPIGNGEYLPVSGLTVIEGWAEYRVRVVLPGDGVGEILAIGHKSSFCLIDSDVYDSGHPQFDLQNRFDRCDLGIQGISPGFQDVYPNTLRLQWIDITDIPPGTYWLESEVNPTRKYLETNFDNNTARIKITITAEDLPPTLALGAWGRVGSALILLTLGAIVLRKNAQPKFTTSRNAARASR